jgi:superfamily II DNA/RNA helicase
MSVRSHACVGGNPTQDDVRRLRQVRVHVIVGTPGRIHDLMISRRVLEPDQLNMFVLDEAGVMLSRHYTASVGILQQLPLTAQRCLFSSAPLVDDTLRFAKDLLRDAVLLESSRPLNHRPLEGTRQYFVDVGEKREWKFVTLCDVFGQLPIAQAVVFCNTRKGVAAVADRLQEKEFDFTVLSMHGELNGKQRESVVKEFQQGTKCVLVTTDLTTAAGIQTPLLVNFDMPTDEFHPAPEVYARRLGACRKGSVLSLLTREDLERGMPGVLEEFMHARIVPMPANVSELL